MNSALFFSIKVIFSALIIAGVSELAKKMPSLGGLIAAMPLTTLLALVWLYTETRDYELATAFTRSVLFAIIPTTFFFITALVLFRRGWPFLLIILVSFCVFALAAVIHQIYIPEGLR